MYISTRIHNYIIIELFKTPLCVWMFSTKNIHLHLQNYYLHGLYYGGEPVINTCIMYMTIL